jgi:hypothetical protein
MNADGNTQENYGHFCLGGLGAAASIPLPGVHSGAASPRPAAERDGELGQKIAANWSRRISRVQAIIRGCA